MATATTKSASNNNNNGGRTSISMLRCRCRWCLLQLLVVVVLLLLTFLHTPLLTAAQEDVGGGGGGGGISLSLPDTFENGVPSSTLLNVAAAAGGSASGGSGGGSGGGGGATNDVGGDVEVTAADPNFQIGPADWIYAAYMTMTDTGGGSGTGGGGGGGGSTNGNGNGNGGTNNGNGGGGGMTTTDDLPFSQVTTVMTGVEPGMDNVTMMLTTLISTEEPADVVMADVMFRSGFLTNECTSRTCSGWLPLDNYLIVKSSSDKVRMVMPTMRTTSSSSKTRGTRGGATSTRGSTGSGSGSGSSGNSTTTTSRSPAAQSQRRRRAAGSVTSEAVRSLNVDDVRTILDSNLDGYGLKIGILSDSFDTSAAAATSLMQDQSSGDLPSGSGIQIIKDFFNASDEGRAMAQLMYDVVPQASFAYYTAFGGIQDFANGIQILADNGCDVIVDDVRYFAEPTFQDGIIAQSANSVARDRNVPYFSSAGNQDDNSWEGPFRDSGTEITFTALDGSIKLGNANDFDPTSSNVDIRQRITLTGPSFIVLQWDDPFFSVSGGPGADSDVDLFVLNAGTNTAVTFDTADNRGGDAVAIVQVRNAGNYDILITLASGPAPQNLKWFAFGGVTDIEYDTNSSTSYGQPNQDFTAGVGASFFDNTPEFGQSPPLLESFSSKGGAPILFNTDGSRKSSPEIRMQPRFVATDGNINTFFGQSLNLAPNGAGFYFFGTSAAAPNAAAVALLIKQADPSLSPIEIYKLLESTAIDMESPGYDVDSGFGYINAFAAVSQALGGPDVSSSPSLSIQPSVVPSSMPSTTPSGLPTGNQPSLSIQPSAQPSAQASAQPSTSFEPSVRPSLTPSFQPSAQPSLQPSLQPSTSFEPSVRPSLTPSVEPSNTQEPSVAPSASPTPARKGKKGSKKGKKGKKSKKGKTSDAPSISPSPTSTPAPSGKSSKKGKDNGKGKSNGKGKNGKGKNVIIEPLPSNRLVRSSSHEYNLLRGSGTTPDPDYGKWGDNNNNNDEEANERGVFYETNGMWTAP